eukprot:CAMPEP_0202781130 /NCGR_PEP_ID=MMETSP1388-20130828/60100_1 /ASSEMBLY_ACC=CAM_ASM_000864 /TAXON_ID=37098 /ORGANISM="Isochrysis sp, Strain CCMP1244" /LENGTH=141 /DNA_ID=CAMNT_0049450531 /DNA_START=145 /DNA_END=566 /DNA_ORIENTATION=-
MATLGHLRVARPFDRVVVRELLPLGDLHAREEAEARHALHVPLLHLQVGRAAVVDEARHVALARRVDDLVRVERHEVHVLIARERALALLPRALVNHLPNVLDDELALRDAARRLDAPPLGLGQEERHRRRLLRRQLAVRA